MRVLSLVLIIFIFCTSVFAEEIPNVAFKMTCVSAPGEMIKDAVIDSSFVWGGFHTELGPTAITVTRRDDGKALVNLKGEDQDFFRETELGLMFFGVYKNANLTAPKQTVYVGLAYKDMTSVLFYVLLYKQGKIKELPKDRDFLFTAFAKEDKESTVTTQLKCNFSVPGKI